MKLGDDENHLIIESHDLGDGNCSVLRIKVGAKASGEIFTAQHDSVVSDSSPGKQDEFRDFESLRRHQIEIRLSHKGWLRLERDGHGHISVRYRLVGWKTVAAMEGEQIIEAEFANAFYKDFWKILRA